MTEQDLAANLRFFESRADALVEMFDAGGNSRPRLLVRFADGEFRRGKCRIGERADEDGDDVGNVVDAIGYAATAFRTQVKRRAVAAVADPHIPNCHGPHSGGP